MTQDPLKQDVEDRPPHEGPGWREGTKNEPQPVRGRRAECEADSPGRESDGEAKQARDPSVRSPEGGSASVAEEQLPDPAREGQVVPNEKPGEEPRADPARSKGEGAPKEKTKGRAGEKGAQDARGRGIRLVDDQAIPSLRRVRSRIAGIGPEPEPRSASWKARRSNRTPSLRLHSARSSRISFFPSV